MTENIVIGKDDSTRKETPPPPQVSEAMAALFEKAKEDSERYTMVVINHVKSELSEKRTRRGPLEKVVAVFYPTVALPISKAPHKQRSSR